MTKHTCSVNDCTDDYYGKGFCKRHWYRWNKHGDPLAGRTPVGDPMAFIQKAVAYVGDDCLEWPYAKQNYGHGQLVVDGRRVQAHRLVLERVQGPPEDSTMFAAHKPVVCHNPPCVNPKHLMWATAEENQQHTILDGTCCRGERAPNSKLTASDVLKIRDDDRPAPVIAGEYSVSETTIRQVKRRERWSWLNEEEVAA